RWAGKVGGFALRALAGRRTRRSADRVFHPRVPAACRRVGARARAVVLEGLLGACLSFLWAAAWSCRTAARGRRRKKVTVVFVLFGRVEFPAHCLPVMQRGGQSEVAGVHGRGISLPPGGGVRLLQDVRQERGPAEERSGRAGRG